jgi:hypothetical protein
VRKIYRLTQRPVFEEINGVAFYNIDISGLRSFDLVSCPPVVPNMPSFSASKAEVTPREMTKVDPYLPVNHPAPLLLSLAQAEIDRK